ncbi:Selenoprotein T [Heterocephalus glaber]|uniref:Selenoprotein T n=1 Tax=Heterocephalus glaber TaxID=10181 RepID=G5AZN5_HETGA|nr:Selenoprotein T [Heterocephalus glaber]
MRLLLLLLMAASAVVRSEASGNLGGVPSKRLKMQYATGPLLKFQIWYVHRSGRPAAPLLAGVSTRGPGFAA